MLETSERRTAPLDDPAASDATSQLLVDVAHDLRSPLASILLLTDTVRSGVSGPVTPLMRQQLDLVFAAAASMSAAVTEIMSAGLAEASAELGCAAFSIAEVLDSVRDVVQVTAAATGHDVIIRAPATSERRGRPRLLHRVLVNLATNAVLHTPAGRVHVSAEVIDDVSVRFSVRDDGPGLPHHVRSTLGSSCGPAASPSGERTGRGLVMCTRLVREMGGRLEWTPTPARGALLHFTINLPAVDAY